MNTLGEMDKDGMGQGEGGRRKGVTLQRSWVMMWVG